MIIFQPIRFSSFLIALRLRRIDHTLEKVLEIVWMLQCQRSNGISNYGDIFSFQLNRKKQ